MQIPEVKMYIEVEFHGRPDSGEGKYMLILECELSNGEKGTKSYFGGFINTTKHRLFINAVISGLSHLTTTCQVEVITNSPYITETLEHERMFEWERYGWIRRNELVKNRDLWQRLIKYMDDNFVNGTCVKEHEYSKYMKTMLQKNLVEYVEDIREQEV